MSQPKLTVYRFQTTCSACKALDNKLKSKRIPFEVKVIRQAASFACGRCQYKMDMDWTNCDMCADFNKQYDNFVEVKRIYPKGTVPILVADGVGYDGKNGVNQFIDTLEVPTS